MAFTFIILVNYTCTNMEMLLDGVAEGKVNWKQVVSNFYPDLETAVNEAEKELEKIPNPKVKQTTYEHIHDISEGKRDFRF